MRQEKKNHGKNRPLWGWGLLSAVLVVQIVLTGGTAARADEALVPIPRPAAGTVEDAVLRELVAAHDLVQKTASQSTAPEVRAAAYGELGQLYAAYELWDAARAAFYNARSLAPNDFRQAYYLALAEERRGDLDAALARWTEALALDPTSALAWLRRGEVELTAGDAAAARQSFQQALAFAAETETHREAAAHFGLARALDRLGESTAIEHYERALELAPGATQIHYPLAQALRRTGREAEAREHLAARGEAGIALADPLLFEIERKAGGGAFHKFRGDQAVLAGDHEAAAEAYRQAVAADPKNFYYRKSLGLTLYHIDQRSEGIETLVEALDLEPQGAAPDKERAELHFAIGSIAFNQGQYYPAWQHFLATIGFDAEYVDAYLQLGNIRGLQKDLGQAVEFFGQALELAPDRIDIRLQHATTLMDLERFAEAIPDLRHVLELEPDHPQAEQLLKIASERVGQQEG